MPLARMIRRMLLTAASLAAAGYLAIVALVWIFQARLLYFPDRAVASSPADWDLPGEEVWLTAEDGVRLHAWFIPASSPDAPTLLYLHGNGGNISHVLPDARTWRAAGFSAFLLDYRGYGRSEGRPGEAGLYRDAWAAWEHLTRERGVSPDRIVIWGHSLGGGVAAQLAARLAAQPTPAGSPGPAALVLDSTFTSVVDRGAATFPFLPVRLVARDRYETLPRLASVRAPVIVAHSRGDDVIPYSDGRALYAAAPEPKAWIELSGGHMAFTATPGALDALAAFLAAHAPGGGAAAR